MGSGVSFRDIAVSRHNEIFVTGYYYEDFDADPGSGTHLITSDGGNDNFIYKLAYDGSFAWAFTLNNPNELFVEQIEVDSSGNIYLGGTFMFSFDADPSISTYTLTTPNTSGFLLKIKPVCTPSHTTISATSCETYSWNGTDYTSSGTYQQTLMNEEGCDSIVELELTIGTPSTSYLVYDTISAVTVNGITYSETGIYTQVIPGSTGCDSTIVINLTIPDTIVQATACAYYKWEDSFFTSSGEYFLTTTNTMGEDSTIMLDLTINDPDIWTMNEQVCGPFSIYDSTFTESGNYIFLAPDSIGCVAIDLHLYIGQPSIQTVSTYACDSFTLNGTEYTASGTYTQVVTSTSGCDSSIVLDLTILHPSSSSLTIVSCDDYNLNGTVYSPPGIYIQVIPNAAGCDSTITLTLQMGIDTYSTIDTTVAGSFTYEGTTYSESGTYTVTGQTPDGCNHTLTINLTIDETGVSEREVSTIRIFPNPFKNDLQLSWERPTSVVISVTDLQGKAVSQPSTFTGTSAELDLRELADGCYFIRMQGDNLDRVFKVLKE